jgi:hypothetical protein
VDLGRGGWGAAADLRRRWVCGGGEWRGGSEEVGGLGRGRGAGERGFVLLIRLGFLSLGRPK